MPWSLILNWRVIFAAIVAVTLTITHWKAYVAGKSAVLDQVKTTAMANERAARAREQALVDAKQKAEEAYEAQKLINRRAISGAQSELGRLRNTLTARAAAAPAATSPRTDAADTPERELFGQCAETLAGMAAEADRHTATVSGLQAYVKGVCLAPQ